MSWRAVSLCCVIVFLLMFLIPGVLVIVSSSLRDSRLSPNSISFRIATKKASRKFSKGSSKVTG